MMLEAQSELMGITVTPWQLASTRDMLPALVQAVAPPLRDQDPRPWPAQ
jgi:hypothetical protein